VLEQPGLGPACEEPDVARERELQSGAERVAAHGRDRRVARGLEPAVRLLHAQDPRDRRILVRIGLVARQHGVRAATTGEHAGVDPGRERATLPDHDERPDRRVVADLVPERAQLVPHLRGEAVELVGAVQPQPRDLAVARQLERFHPTRVATRAR
jgi:hypothetical protein